MAKKTVTEDYVDDRIRRVYGDLDEEFRLILKALRELADAGGVTYSFKDIVKEFEDGYSSHDMQECELAGCSADDHRSRTEA